MDWFDGTLGYEIAGVPTFWIARVAKFLQFVSGMVILVEIIGEDRIDHATTTITNLFSRISGAAPLRTHIRKSWQVQDLDIWAEGGNRLNVRTLSAVIAGVVVTLAWLIYGLLTLEWEWRLETVINIAWLIVGAMAVWLAAVILIGMILAIMGIVFLPLELVIHLVSRLILFVLRRKQLSDVLLILSFVLLTLGFFLELLVS